MVFPGWVRATMSDRTSVVLSSCRRMLATECCAPQPAQHVGGLEELPLVVRNFALHDQRGEHGGDKLRFAVARRCDCGVTIGRLGWAIGWACLWASGAW